VGRGDEGDAGGRVGVGRLQRERDAGGFQRGAVRVEVARDAEAEVVHAPFQPGLVAGLLAGALAADDQGRVAERDEDLRRAAHLVLRDDAAGELVGIPVRGRLRRRADQVDVIEGQGVGGHRGDPLVWDA
jgi:hypothetical protein